MSAFAPDATSQVAESLSNLGLKSEEGSSKADKKIHEIFGPSSHLDAGITFSDASLRIPEPILQALTVDMRFERPSVIQARAIPLIIQGQSVVAQSQSGSGKTVTFTVGMLTKINPDLTHPQAICLAPTRELVFQIAHENIVPLSKHIKPAIVVGTPVSVKNWINSKMFDPKKVRILVVDEADDMIAKTDAADTIKVRNLLPRDVQILFFSATYPKDILPFSTRVMGDNYAKIFLPNKDLVLREIFQIKMDLQKAGITKLTMLQNIYSILSIEQSIIFVETKASCDAVAAQMCRTGYEVSVIHSGILQEERDAVMNRFRRGLSKVLIATNVLARGVDVPTVAVVINYDLPLRRQDEGLIPDTATYLHRIGRAGRFGRPGVAISFVNSTDDVRVIEHIQRKLVGDGMMLEDWNPLDVDGLQEEVAARVAKAKEAAAEAEAEAVIAAAPTPAAAAAPAAAEGEAPASAEPAAEPAAN